jgi:hypothetical protein
MLNTLNTRTALWRLDEARGFCKSRRLGGAAAGHARDGADTIKRAVCVAESFAVLAGNAVGKIEHRSDAGDVADSESRGGTGVSARLLPVFYGRLSWADSTASLYFNTA